MSGTATSFNYVEMLLYHGLDVTGSVELSLVGDTGPWTKVTLTSTKGVQDALTEWASLASTALSQTFTFVWFDDGGPSVELSCEVEFWVRLAPTLAELLGWSTSGVLHATFGGSWHLPSSSAPLAVLNPAAIGRNQPRVVEESDLEEHRMGRASVHHYSRRTEVELELYIAEDGRAGGWASSEVAEDWMDSPIISGHAAFYVVMLDQAVDGDTAEDYGELYLGGRLLCFPVDTPAVEAVEGSGGEVVVTLRCTTEGG